MMGITPNLTVITIILGGWADIESQMVNLRTFLETQVGKVNHFRYSSEKQSPLESRFANMETLAHRFYQYLSGQHYLDDPAISLNIVGYSQGGMVALYAAGLYPEIRKKICKYVAIASPHGGSLEKSLRQTLISGYTGLKKKAQSNFLGAIAMAILDLGVESLDLINLLDNNSIFLTRDYPAAVIPVFKDIPKQNLLQIYSPKDFVATPESCKRFEAHMTTYSIEDYGHQEIVQNEKVIQVIIDFLSGKEQK